MRKLGILLVLSCLVFQVRAQNASEIVAKFQQFVQNSRQYSAQFSYSLHVPQEQVDVKEEGKSWVKDQWAKLELKNHTIYMDGQARWTYSPATQEVVITKLGTKPEDMLANPNQLILRYVKQTDAKLVGKSNVQGKSAIELQLTPKNPKSTIKQIFLLLDEQTYAPIRIHYIGKDGSQMQVKFIKFNLISGAFPIQEVRFDPKKYKDAEIVDMR